MRNGVIEDHWIRTWSLMGTASGGELIQDDGTLLVRAGLDHFPYNQVLRSSPEADPDAVIDTVLQEMAGREAAWTVMPSSSTSELTDRLVARGCAHYATVTGMWCEVDDLRSPSLPSDLRFERVGPELLPRWADLVLDQWHLSEEDRETLLRMHHMIGFEMVQRWLVFIDDVPVAKASTAMYDPDVVGLYGVGTKPEARGRGIASMLTAHALRAAGETGARTAVLHSTPMAVGIYRDLGFTEAFTFPVYTLPRAVAEKDRLTSL